MNDKPQIIHISKHLSVAVTFIWSYEQIDPRCAEKQTVITCILRPIDDCRREIYYGVAVHNPRDPYDKAQGQKIALARAIQNMTWEDYRTSYSMARRWFWMQDQAAQVPASVAVEVAA